MFNFRSIAWKLFKGAKIHVVTSISIIAVAICLIVTMATYIHNAKATLDETIEQQFGKMDLLAGFDYGQGQYISNELYEEVKALPEVEAISPVSLEMTNIEQLKNVYTLGVENDELVKSRYHFEEDVTTETIILSELLADFLGGNIGDSVVWNDETLTVLEILPTPIGAEPFQMAIVHNEKLQAPDNKALFMLIETDDTKSLFNTLQNLQDGLRIDVVDEYDFVKMNVQTLLIFIVVLSIFILFITGLLLLSTMQLLFTKLNGQLMILRSLGASTGQIVKLVRMQLLLIVTSGLILGTLLTLGTIQFALPMLIDWMQLPAASTEVPAALVLIVVIIVGMFLSGYMSIQLKKAMHILPLQITKDQEQRTFKLSKWKLIVVGIVTVIALLLMLVGQLEGNGVGALQIVIGSLLLALIVLYLIPFAFQWILKGTLQPIRMLFGKEAYLACQQLIPQIRVNIKIVLSLVGLIVILVFGSSVLKSIQSNEQAYIQERFESDYILNNSTANMNLYIDVLTELQQSPIHDIQSVESMGSSIAISYDGQIFNVLAKDLKSFGIEGALDNKIVISEDFAKQNNIVVGDIIKPYLYYHQAENMQQQDAFEVVHIFKPEEPSIGAYIDWTSNYAKNNLPIDEVKVNTTDIEALKEFVSQQPLFHLLEKEESIEQAETMFNQRWSLFIGVFGVLLIATTMGIIQTLWHLVYTNRSQYTIQRLLGLSPNGLVKYLCMQVLTFTLYGLLSGFIVGTLLTRLVALIDKNGHIGFDFMTIGIVSGTLLLLLLVVFGLQGWIISRRKLSNEMLQL